jgi:hypothetical protein
VLLEGLRVDPFELGFGDGAGLELLLSVDLVNLGHLPGQGRSPGVPFWTGEIHPAISVDLDLSDFALPVNLALEKDRLVVQWVVPGDGDVPHAVILHVKECPDMPLIA